MNIYQQQLLDHYHQSPYKGSMSAADFCSDEHNPSCGDRVTVYGRVKNQVLVELTFEGAGCVISQAAASLLCHESREKDIEQVLMYDAAFMLSLVGIPLGPTRLKCALLALHALKQGLMQHQGKKHA